MAHIYEYREKYQMSFHDVKGFLYTVEFLKLQQWDTTIEYDITPLTGSETPVTLSFNASKEDDHFDPIRDFKAEINILQPGFNNEFYSDISTGDDIGMWCKITDVTRNKKYSGWAISDQGKRSFDKTMQELTIEVVSPFSTMRGKELAGSNGLPLFGKNSLRAIITAALARSLPDFITPSIELHTSYNEVDAPEQDILTSLSVSIEGFNDEGGRPPKCYDILHKIMSSLGLFCIWEDSKLKIFDPFDFGSLTPKELKIKYQNIGDNFLTGNTEHVTKIKASKEISTNYDYGKTIGLLRDGRFLNINSSGILSFWNYAPAFNGSTVIRSYTQFNVYRVGTGRSFDPYGVRMVGDGGDPMRSLISPTEPLNQGLFSDAITKFKSGDKIGLKVRFRYKDYKSEYGISPTDKKIPWLLLFVHIMNEDTGTPMPGRFRTVIDCQDLDYTDKAAQLNGVSYLENVIFPSAIIPATAAPNTYVFYPIFIAVDSIEDIQEYNKEIAIMPFNGYVTVNILGAAWIDGDPSPAVPSGEKYVDIIDVTLSREAFANGTRTKGEKTFLTQAGEYSGADDEQNVHMGTFRNDSISGVFYRSADGEFSNGVERTGFVQDKAQNWLLSSRMAFKIRPSYRVDCNILSTDLQYSDVVRFKDGTSDIMPGSYQIMKYERDLKNCEINLTALQLNRNYLPYRTDAPPDDSNNLFENFKTSQ